jgi:hypothetical protein
MGRPAFGDAAAIEHDVVETGSGQQVAHRQPGLAGSDDDGGEVRHG